MTEPAAARSNSGIHLNGATIMTTPTGRQIQIARDTGYAGVEVRAERLLENRDEVRAVEAIARPGEIWSLNGIQLQVCGDGSLDRDRLAADLPPRVDVCRALGAAYLLVVPPRTTGVERRPAIAAMRRGLNVIVDQTGRHGIRAAFEFLGFGDCPIDSPALAAEVVADVPEADLVLDSCHWHASGSPPIGDFPVDRLAMVHINDAPAKPPREIEDADRVLPFLGVIDLPSLVDQLRQRGYAGPWSLETFNPTYWERDPVQVALDGRASLRRLLEPAVAAR